MEMANKRYTDAEIDQILRENAQLRKWLAEYQKAAREQRKASEKRYAERRRGSAWQRMCARMRKAWTGLRRGNEALNEALNEAPRCVAVILSLISGLWLAVTIAMAYLEVTMFETVLWMQRFF